MPFLAEVTPKTFLLGLPLVLLGEALRVWAGGHLTKLTGLAISGPFALCRNPIYIGTFLMTAGYLVMCNQVSLLILGMALFWLFHGGAIAYEEKLLRDKHGEDYIRYCERVPRFIPRLHLDLGDKRFSVTLLIENCEYIAVLSAAVIVGLFALKAYFGQMLWHASIW